MNTFQTLLTILVPLVIIMDPLGNLVFFMLFTRDHTATEQNRIAAVASGCAGAILVFFALTGDSILRFFGIGLPAFQLAGGLIFLIYALQLLHLIPSGIKTSTEEEEEGIEKDNVALVPLATPLMAGPGAITAVLVWRAANSPASTLLLIVAIVVACSLSYGVFRYGKLIQRIMGVGGIRVITRLTGLLLAVIAVQFMVGGLQSIIPH